DRFECAHRRIHAARQQRSCALEKFVVRTHRMDSVASNKSVKRRVVAPISGASNTAEIAARKSAPAATNDRPLSGVTPPIATSGLPNARAARSKSGVARCACRFVGDGKKAPKAR